MKNISSNKQMTLNLSATLIVFILNISINFFLSPYIVSVLGVEANGFIQLANNFVSYVTIITMALNSMASRFITVSFHKNDNQKANEYYSSVFVGNIVISLVLMIPVGMGIIFLDNLISISYELINQVRLLFFFVFLNFFFTMIFPPWTVAFFVTNRVYMQSIGKIIFNIVNAFLIILLFVCLPVQIWYIGVAMTISTLILQYWQYIGKKKLLTKISFKRKNVKLSSIKTLVSSGIWNSINQLGVILFYGLDLVMINLFINAETMGLASIAKIVPTIFGSLQSSIMNTFTPSLTILYAKGRISDLVDEIFKAGRLLLIIMGVPFSGFIIFGEIFFSLWMPNQDSSLLQTLSIISMISLVFILGTLPLWQVFVIVNKNKTNSFTVVAGGIINFTLTFVALQITDFGVFAVLGVSSLVSLLRNILFTVPFSAKYLGLEWYSFFPLISLTCVTLAVNLSLGFVLNHIFFISNWSGLIGVVCIFSLLSLFLNSFIIFNKNERENLIKSLAKK